ncbi:MAG: hypothetical protein IJU95_02230, partial [Treponema sp.]|nr:hypothetical protein [Treponema sp.]
YKNELKLARRKAEKKAEKKGLAEGRAAGLAEARAETVRNMLADNVPPEKIALYTGLSLEQVERLAAGEGQGEVHRRHQVQEAAIN